MSYRFYEVRKGECERVVAFASEHNCQIAPETLRHHLSLVVEAESQTVAAALCVERELGQLVIEIISANSEPDQALLTELADRCLRKVQAEAITSTRLHSTTEQPTDMIWSQTNWLDRVAETPPPGTDPIDENPAQAA